ncbi:MAG: hypothetical protein IM600_10740 [Bacteroidetes bacterium]|jgi:hypothetical protein|nr:hypothetical protein [Bacteroidota bacterium]MCA6443895.1 hypothetical protein [Bacteroidota bacterium]
MKTLSLIITLILVTIFNLKAQYFEYVVGGKESYFCFIKITDNKVTGYTINKLNLEKNNLEGEYTNNEFKLFEKNKSSKTVRSFMLTNESEMLGGSSRKGEKGDFEPATFYKSDSSFIPTKKFDGITELKEYITIEGVNLGNHIKDKVGISYGKGIKILSFYKNIISISYELFDRENDDNGNFVSSYKNFSFETKKEITIMSELDPIKIESLRNYLKKSVETEALTRKNSVNEKDWISLGNKKQEINDAFATKEITDQRLAEFYFQRNNVVYSFKDYFSFGDLNESFNYIPQVTIPNSEFKKYLKPNSILNNLIN